MAWIVAKSFNSLQVVQVRRQDSFFIFVRMVSIPYRQSRYLQFCFHYFFIREFQFLIGSLGTYVSAVKLEELWEFQFLIGSLGTGGNIAANTHPFPGFNSLQVVQVRFMYPGHGGVKMFQFLIGSLGTELGVFPHIQAQVSIPYRQSRYAESTHGC